MQQSFDIFGQVELPYIILCNPNLDELYSLGLAYNTKITLRYNALSEFSFTFPKSIDGEQTILTAYDYLENKRLVFIENIGYFQIMEAKEAVDGGSIVKDVTCQSLEVELIQKKVFGYGGTKKLYDPISPTGTVLYDMIQLAPNWSVGDVDGSLLTLYRTFNVSNSNIYNFLMVDVEKAFQCVFFFDTTTRTINVKSYDNATTTTDIFISSDNLIDKADVTEISDEIVTGLTVSGGAGLTIGQVNPLGGNEIYNFDYYKNTNWMSQNLVDAITAWEALVATQQPIYAADLLLLETYNSDLLTLQTTLATYNEDLLTLQGVQKSRIQANLPYSDINAQITAKNAQITAQNTLIANKNAQIATVTATLQAINTLVSFANNFTTPQLLELNSFIYENTYQNDNIIQTDSMTLVEVQQQAQQLYDQAVSVLAVASTPRYTMNLTSVNYLDLPMFSVFTEQTELGCVVTVEVDDDRIIETVLLELSYQLDNPQQFSITFSNRLRLDNGKFVYSDLQGQVVSAGSAVAFNSAEWSNWSANYKDDVTTFINSSLDTTVNNLISNTNQEILINQNGLRARQSTGSGTYSGQQAWLVNNMLAFSTDGFTTAKLALGQITNPTGGTSYGLVADVIVGRLLAGNSLTITNSGNNFTLDSTGATLTNAKFSIQTTNTKVIIDPTSTISFRIQKNVGGTFTDKFWVDNSGNVNFAGTLSGATGTFTGTLTAAAGNIGTLVIDSLGLKTADGINYLRGDGSLKWGGLTISGSSATFNGTIFANKLSGQVVDSQVASGLNAGKVTNGSMSGDRLYGGSPTLASIDSTGSSLSMGHVTLAGIINTGSYIGVSMNLSSNISIGGSITVTGGNGLSGLYSVYTSAGYKYFSFSRGLLVGVF